MMMETGPMAESSITDAIAERAFQQRDELAEALKLTLALIRKAQDRLSLYLQPDSSGDDHECMNELLGMFDGPEQRAIESAARSALSKAGAL